MKQFRHTFRVFEAETTTGCQIDVTLVPAKDSDQKRVDRVTTGQFMGTIRLIADMTFIDTFEVGKEFTLELTEIDLTVSTRCNWCSHPIIFHSARRTIIHSFLCWICRMPDTFTQAPIKRRVG